ncbi:MAG: hypothetical protein KIT09_28015 [Bryobacteraceae bacterium]|nr:hypothetical protein [Bryobacteraceae bacterium]
MLFASTKLPHDKVFDFSRRVEQMPKGRQAPQHPWPKVFDAVFLGAATQIPSLLQIEAECRRGALAKRIGPVSDDTIGYALQRQSPEPVFTLTCEVARRLKRNGVLRSDWSRGLVVAAVDGIEICRSFLRCCNACLQREVQHKVRGELRTDIQYYHRIVAAVIVSTPFPVPLGIRFQKQGEAEVPCALALWKDLVDQLGPRFVDLLVGDAIYLQAPFVKQVERLGLDWAFTLKENQPELLREAQRFTGGPPATVQSGPKQELRCWHLPQVDWPVADRWVRVSKRFASTTNGQSPSARMASSSRKARPTWRWRAPTSTPPILNWVPFPQPSSINSAAADGASTRRSFRPSPPPATSNISPSTKAPPWSC